MSKRPDHAWPGPTEDGQTESAQTLPEPVPQQLVERVFQLSKASGVEARPEDLVHTYVSTLGQLFPQRMFCVRLCDLEDGNMSVVYATGRLNETGRHEPTISRSALERHSIGHDELPLTIKVTETYELLFEQSGSGFDVALVDGDSLSGMLSVEYAPGTTAPESDRAWIVQLAMQLASALRNGRLHQESEYLRGYLGKLLDHANAPIMVVSRDGVITLANRSLLSTTGLDRDDVIGREWTALFPRDEQPRLLPIYLKALQGQPATNIEVRLSTRTGTAHMSLNSASIMGPDSDVESVINIFRDVTEVRELQEQVIQSEKLATLGQLAAGVVHELNNPLTSISVYGEYLVRKYNDDGDPDDVVKLQRIVESADRILKFSQDLVSYARPTTETPAEIPITEVLDQAAVFCEHVLEEVGAELDTNYEEGIPPVLGVRGQLVQVWVNLITNACHAMPLGAGRLLLSARVDQEALMVAVTDNGPGIPAQHLERLFEPFFSTKGEGKGTGLGLSIVRKIIHQHGGQISVRSEVGQGTSMEVTLPAITE